MKLPKSIIEQNSNYTVNDLIFIESWLNKNGIYSSFDEIVKNHLSVFIEEKTESEYIIHIGSEDPYSGGIGANYIINRDTDNVSLVSTKDLTPIPDDVLK